MTQVLEVVWSWCKSYYSCDAKGGTSKVMKWPDQDTVVMTLKCASWMRCFMAVCKSGGARILSEWELVVSHWTGCGQAHLGGTTILLEICVCHTDAYTFGVRGRLDNCHIHNHSCNPFLTGQRDTL